MEDDNVLFVRSGHKGANERGSNSNMDDLWDDSVLIKAYDKAVNLAKAEVAKRLSVDTNRTTGGNLNDTHNENDSQKKWKVGSPCRAIYSVDGEIYEAIIIKIFHDDGKCLVKFIGYNNVEKVELSSLDDSKGLESQLAQQATAAAANAVPSFETHKHRGAYGGTSGNNHLLEEDMEYETNPTYDFKSNASSNSDSRMPPPPLLPPNMIQLPNNDADALSSMLMSWYISGFHTGYYHGMKQKNSRNKKK